MKLTPGIFNQNAKIAWKSCYDTILGISFSNFLGALFSQNFSKILPKSKIEKNKKIIENILTWFSSNLSIFNSKLFFLACHRIILPKKVIFCHFLKKKKKTPPQKTALSVKIISKTDFLTHFHSRNVYFFIRHS